MTWLLNTLQVSNRAEAIAHKCITELVSCLLQEVAHYSYVVINAFCILFAIFLLHTLQ